MKYTVCCKEYSNAKIDSFVVEAKSKVDAYGKAVYEVCPYSPYSAWVDSVMYSSGKSKRFNTFEGNPY